MITYRYVAQDYAGDMREGLTKAACEADVLGWLHEQGYTPVSVDMVSLQTKTRWRPAFVQTITSAELAAVFWQLSTMIDGGITIAEALEAIAEDIENRRLQKVLHHTLANIERGGTFSEGMAAFPRVFNTLTSALILAGETGGNIGEAFQRVAEYYTDRDRLARKVKKAVAYPAFVVGFVVFVVVIIMTLIIPRFRVMFDQFGSRQLPAFTRGFMGVYDTLMSNGLYIVGSIVLAILAAIIALKCSGTVHHLCSRLVLRLPLFGKLVKQAFVATLCRTMANLLRGGVSVLEVLDILHDMTRNDIMKLAISRTRADIVGGTSIHLAMAGTRFFPNMVVKMVRAGEESGSLWRVLEKSADYFEEKVDALIANMITMLEPLLIITVGALVLVVVLALYLPIFQITDIRA